MNTEEERENRSVLAYATSSLSRFTMERFVERTPGFDSVGTTIDAAQVPALVSMHRPDLVILDGSLGVPVLGEVFPVGFRDDFSRMKVLVVVPQSSDRAFLEARDIGADAMVSMDQRGHQIRSVMNSMFGDTAFFSHREVERVKARYENSVEFKIGKLDVCDREILRLLAEGKSDKEIADTVYLANQTVRNRISRLYRHFDKRNRVELAILLCQSGVFEQQAVKDWATLAKVYTVQGEEGQVGWRGAKGA